MSALPVRPSLWALVVGDLIRAAGMAWELVVIAASCGAVVAVVVIASATLGG